MLRQAQHEVFTNRQPKCLILSLTKDEAGTTAEHARAHHNPLTIEGSVSGTKP